MIILQQLHVHLKEARWVVNFYNISSATSGLVSMVLWLLVSMKYPPGFKRNVKCFVSVTSMHFISALLYNLTPNCCHVLLLLSNQQDWWSVSRGKSSCNRNGSWRKDHSCSLSVPMRESVGFINNLQNWVKQMCKTKVILSQWKWEWVCCIMPVRLMITSNTGTCGIPRRNSWTRWGILENI